MLPSVGASGKLSAILNMRDSASESVRMDTVMDAVASTLDKSSFPSKDAVRPVGHEYRRRSLKNSPKENVLSSRVSIKVFRTTTGTG